MRWLVILLLLVSGCSQAFIKNSYDKSGPTHSYTSKGYVKKKIIDINTSTSKQPTFIIIHRADGSYIIREERHDSK